ncbi:septal ring factor EnvC (AmiA/AmiB activator) [Luteibacter sp. Sphag1AF]|uniref:hypothetical protein n=1 Tax=Luteibacter sp. Sphag1AF TaxID=2587031 RepID=UPI001611D0A1|nr:hypothetical protein [Luteibacter sp. Sphag1AF]MBB3229005.1 septal ring factor EnvC (AmiA/AmiB activator) [Luteibacter sp. Sphag1AF]
MRLTAGFALLLLAPLCAAAGQRDAAAPASASSVASARATAAREAAASQAAELQKLQKRLDALENDTRSAQDKLRERDRIIAELEAQLKSAGHP